jgi:hypothetical protein
MDIYNIAVACKIIVEFGVERPMFYTAYEENWKFNKDEKHPKFIHEIKL